MYIHLMNWCDKNQSIDRTKKYFWRYFEMYKREEPEEFKAVFKYGFSDIELSASKISYRQNYPDYDGGFVCVTMDIFRKKDKVGWYKMFYRYKDGSEFDDFFELYDEYLPEEFK